MDGQTEDAAAGAASREEVASLDRLLTRLALTEDDKLEKVLSKLLPLAIGRFASPHEASRKKVLEMLTHINKRVRDHSQIKLPLEELLALYRSPVSATVPMVFNFAMVYTEMAFERAATELRFAVLPDIFQGVATRPVQHQGMLLRIAAMGLEPLGAERNGINELVAERFAFLKQGEDGKLWLEFCLHTLLYRPQTIAAEGQSPSPPPGLSLEQAQRVAGNAKQTAALRGERLATQKVAIMNFNSALQLSSADLYLQLLVATTDSEDRVARKAEELLKRTGGSVNLEDFSLVRQIFSLFQGTVGAPAAGDARRRAAAGLTLKLRLLGALTHSAAAANCFPATLQVVFDSVYGEGATMRLKQSGMEFAVWVFKHATEEQLKPMAPVILSGLMKLLEESNANDSDKAVQQLRAFTFQAVGQLAQRAPHLFRGSAQMAVTLFTALRKEAASTQSVLQEAVSALSGAYQGCVDDVNREIEALLLENVAATEDAARFCAVQWACRLFPPTHASARYICILGCGDKKLEIRELAERGLFPLESEEAEGRPIALPTLADMAACIVQQRPQIMAPSPVGEQTLMFPSATYAAMLKFLQRVHQTQGLHSAGEQNGEGEAKGGPNEQYRLILEHGLARDGSWALHAMAAQGLLELAADYPEAIAREYAGRLSWLKQFLSHADASTRETVARVLGITSQALRPDVATELLQELVAPAKLHSSGKYRLEEIAGGLSAAGYVLAQVRTGRPMVDSNVQEATADALVAVLEDASEGLSKTAGEALGHIGLRGPILLSEGGRLSCSEQGSASGQDTAAAAKAEASSGVSAASISGRRVVKRLSELLASSDVKVVQSAVLALGHLCHGEPPLAAAVLDALFPLARSKAEDVLFAVGESLSLIWGGLNNVTADTFLRTPFISLTASYNFLASEVDESREIVMTENTPEAHGNAAVQDAIKGKLLNELLLSARKEERCAGAVWMLSLVTYSGHSPSIQALLPDIQEAFSNLLADSHELTQEMASRGMSLVYNLADAPLREQLVEALVGALSGSARKKRAVKLMEESEVFSDDALGKAPGGGSLNTYKELCTLATDMGQPDLIYKFMDLANYQASLNSRRGAAFGFAKIAKQAGEALQPHLGALVPKLLRHRYDPSKAIQDAMAHIWRALIAEPKKTIDQHWAGIMEDLLKEAGSRLWRARESACLALTDLLPSRRFDEVSPYLADLWIMAFRVADDIKESVRLSGEKLCRTLSSLSIRLGDLSLTPQKDASATCRIVFPILLNQGILSSVTTVRQFSLTTISKLAKGAGPALREVLPDVVAAMLEALSSLEDQTLNYAELHAERVGIDAHKLEVARLSVARGSPMWATLDLCLRHVDAATLDALAPRLVDLARSGVGLNTRVGVARFISQLVQRCGPLQMKPHVAPLLKVLLAAAKSEKSSAARRAFAVASVDVARCAGEARVTRLVGEAAALYAGEKEARICSALLIRELTRSASDLLSAQSTVLLPLTFIARHDPETAVKDLFSEVWDESTSTTSAAVQLYLPETTALIVDGVQSSSWPRKKQCAEATVALAELVREDIGSENVQRLLKAFLQELPGRLWEGKESCLEAVSTLCKNCRAAISAQAPENEGVGPVMVAEAVLAACGRPKVGFKEAALRCLEQVLLAFKNHDLLALAAQPLIHMCTQPTLSPTPSNDGTVPASSSSSNGAAGNGPPVVVLAIACLAAALQGGSPETLNRQAEPIVTVLTTSLGSSTWTVRLAAADAAKKFTIAWTGANFSNKDGEGAAGPHLQAIVTALLVAVDDPKHSQVRSSALEGLQAVLSSAEGRRMLQGRPALAADVRTVLAAVAQADKSAAIRSLAAAVLAACLPQPEAALPQQTPLT